MCRRRRLRMEAAQACPGGMRLASCVLNSMLRSTSWRLVLRAGRTSSSAVTDREALPTSGSAKFQSRCLVRCRRRTWPFARRCSHAQKSCAHPSISGPERGRRNSSTSSSWGALTRRRQRLHTSAALACLRPGMGEGGGTGGAPFGATTSCGRSRRLTSHTRRQPGSSPLPQAQPLQHPDDGFIREGAKASGGAGTTAGVGGAHGWLRGPAGAVAG